MMLARNLENSPAADELPQVSSVMAQDLRGAGYGLLRPDKVVAALNELGRELTRWPCPAQVIEKLRGAPSYVTSYLLEHTSQRTTPEMARENITRMKKILAGVGRA